MVECKASLDNCRFDSGERNPEGPKYLQDVCTESPSLVAAGYYALADAMIRILDLCGGMQVPIGEIIEKKLEYNAGRPYKHNKKF